MITSKEIQSIDREYFDIPGASPFYIVLRSRNTKHYWYLLLQEGGRWRSYFIMHKHHIRDPYHPQTHRGSVETACAYIKEHDAYHIKRKRANLKIRAYNDSQ